MNPNDIFSLLALQMEDCRILLGSMVSSQALELISEGFNILVGFTRLRTSSSLYQYQHSASELSAKSIRTAMEAIGGVPRS